MLFTPPPQEFSFGSQASRPKGFTLIELLVVMAVIAILSGITFSISSGVRNAQARAKAKAELATLASSLESFKGLYGDYPFIAETSDTTNANTLLKALTGWSKLDATATPPMSDLDPQASTFLDTGLLGLSKEIVGDTKPDTDTYLVDPWENPYIYVYNIEAGDWENFGYLLMSSGPDGELTLGDAATTGIIDQAWRDDEKNLDNIYLEN